MEQSQGQTQVKSSFLKYYEKYMLVMGVLGQAVFYVQAIQIFINRSAQDVSLSGFVMGFVAVLSWFIYGALIKNRVLMIVNAFAVVGAFLAILGILIHG